MGKSEANPTIRILMLGAPGVGKNCLESRFTTMTYPPPYDPALTLNSRRFFTLSARSRTDRDNVTRPLNTSHSPALQEPSPGQNVDRPRTASSTVSNPASEHRTGDQAGEQHVTGADQELVDDATLVASETCSECARANYTYLVEVINYPSLQNSRVRSHVHAKAEYDAVLLVYDVATRESFDAVKELHSEIPICTRKNHHHHRRAHSSHAAKNRSSGWFGGGANETGATGSGEIVVGLVGNKSDFDAEYASIELDKEAEIQEADVEQRSLVHPLYRESRFYDELNLQEPHSPRSATESIVGRDMAVDVRRSVVSADNDPRRSILSLGRSVRTLPNIREKVHQRSTRPDKTESIEKWLQTGKPTVGESADEGPEEVPEGGMTRIESNDTEATSVARRQVSKLDGEALARTLMLQVPFHETSAKTGDNIEEVFEAMIREVLKEMGREANSSALDGKSCKHRSHHSFLKKRVPETPSREVRPETLLSPAVPRPQDKPATENAMTGEATETAPEGPTGSGDIGEALPPPRRIKRRESMMDKMRKVFMRKQPLVTDIAA